LLLFTAAYFYSDNLTPRSVIQANTQKVIAADGDSFMIGANKLRLKGIDAPEYNQSCSDEAGQLWQCGKAARSSLETLLADAGLTCEAEVRDRYGRALSTCSTAQNQDIAAAQVRFGMALSDEWMGMRSYGAEEDEARRAKRGIWRGDFMHPSEWRAGHKRDHKAED
jgi:endonuclease YncB( thermonuclease family)